MTSTWYLNTQKPSTCSGQLQAFQVEHYLFPPTKGIDRSVTVAVWEPNGAVDMYKIVS